MPGEAEGVHRPPGHVEEASLGMLPLVFSLVEGWGWGLKGKDTERVS